MSSDNLQVLLTSRESAIILLAMAKVSPSPQVDSLICAFGGAEPMAKILGHKYATTVRGWIDRGKIPHWRRGEIVAAAKRERIKLPKWFNGA